MNLLKEALKGQRGEFREAIEAAILIGERKEEVGITALKLKGMKPGDRISDPDRPGLWFRCGARSGVQAVLRYRKPHAPDRGKQVEARIGRWSEKPNQGILLADINSQYEAMRAQIEDGKTPVPERLKRNNGMTVARMCARYIGEYARPYKKSWENDRKNLREFYRVLGRRPAHEITTADVQEIIDSVQERSMKRERAEKKKNPAYVIKPTAGAAKANHVLGTISKCYDFALAIPVKRPKPGQPANRTSWLSEISRNPAKDAQGHGRKAKQYLPPEWELKAWRKVMDHQREAMSAQVLLLQALTFSRINEACAAEWSEIREYGGQWVWTRPEHKMKSGREHKVLLSDAAVSLLDDIRRRSGNASYVFPSPSNAEAPISTQTVQRWWQARRADYGSLSDDLAKHAEKFDVINDGFTPNRLRNAALSYVRTAGGNIDVRNALSDHKGEGVDGDYTQDADMSQQVRIYSERWALYLDDLLHDRDPNGNVVKMRELSA